MDEKQLFKIIDHIADEGLKAIKKHIKQKLPIDYVGIFSKNQQEYNELIELLDKLGKRRILYEKGITFLLHKPYETKAGKLNLIKIRIPDKQKPQRGAPDFRIKNYKRFKQKYLKRKNFNLIVRKEYEMLELKDKNFDILVYFPDIPLSTELGI